MAGESETHIYRHKPTVVRAFRLSCPITVQTPEGPRGGNTGDWFIFDGLRGGDEVVVDGAITLRPGDPVNATPLTTSPPAAPTSASPRPSAGPGDRPAAEASTGSR